MKKAIVNRGSPIAQAVNEMKAEEDLTARRGLMDKIEAVAIDAGDFGDTI